jgi:hypothetical protein
MPKVTIVRKHETTILKGICLLSLLILLILGSTVLMVQVLESNPRSDISTSGWQQTPEVRIIMDSTADWARIMFNDLDGTNQNGLRIVAFRSHGWLSGNDSNDRIDAGFGLSFVDVLYNSTVAKTGDIVGFFKGNNNFRHSKMYVDVVLEVNTGLPNVYVVLMLAGAGTTNFEFINKETGVVIWQDSETGRSFTQYIIRTVPTQAFFAKETINTILVFALIIAGIVTILALNPIPILRPTKRNVDDGGVL